MDNSGNVCFQVNATIKELGNQNVDISTSTAGSHQSSLMFSQGASSNMEDTPHKTDTLSSPLTPLTPQGSVATTKYLETVDAGDTGCVTTQSSTTRKRSCSSPGKSIAKKMFVADDGEGSISQSSGGGVGGSRSVMRKIIRCWCRNVELLPSQLQPCVIQGYHLFLLFSSCRIC
eukprot:XP_020396941.1 uncharacterized protein LOC103632836 isoform X1 [Zea mays]